MSISKYELLDGRRNGSDNLKDRLMEKYKLAQIQKSVKDRNGKKIRLRWNTATEVRRSLARVNNMVLNGEILKGDANAIYYSANLILKAIELESIELSRNGRK